MDVTVTTVSLIRVYMVAGVPENSKGINVRVYQDIQVITVRQISTNVYLIHATTMLHALTRLTVFYVLVQADIQETNVASILTSAKVALV